MTDGQLDAQIAHRFTANIAMLGTISREQLFETNLRDVSGLANLTARVDDIRQLAVQLARCQGVRLDYLRWGRFSQLAMFDQAEIQAATRSALEQAVSTGARTLGPLPRLPLQAGQIIYPSEAMLLDLTVADPELAEQIVRGGWYVNLGGVLDLGPCAAEYTTQEGERRRWPSVSLGEIGPDHDLSSLAGREQLALDDRRRALGAYRAAGPVLAVANLEEALAFIQMQYSGTGRSMVPVRAELVALAARLDSALIAPRGVVVDLGPEPVTAPTTVQRPLRRTVHWPELAMTNARVWYDPDVLRRFLAIPDPEPADGENPGNQIIPAVPHPESADGGIAGNQVNQGIIGDCAEISILRALARLRPTDINKAIRANDDGTYTVTLHLTQLIDGRWTRTGPTEVTVTPDIPVSDQTRTTSDGSVTNILFASPAHGAIWGPIIEKALTGLGQLWSAPAQSAQQESWNTAHPEALEQRSLRAMPDGYQLLDNGSPYSYQAEVLRYLTGQPAVVSHFPNPSELTSEQVTEIKDNLRAMLSAGSPIIVSTRGDTPPGLVTAHAYGIVEVTEDGLVQLDNPWGISQPDPITVQDLIQVVVPSYVHLELPADSDQPTPGTPITAVGIPGTEFTGMFGEPNSAQVLDAVVNLSEADLAEIARAAHVHSIVFDQRGRLQVTLSSGGQSVRGQRVAPRSEPVRRRNVAPGSVRPPRSEPGVRSEAGASFTMEFTVGDLGARSGHGSDDVVAHTRHMSGRGRYAVRLSDRLSPGAVAEAIAHEVREVVTLRHGSLWGRLIARATTRPDQLGVDRHEPPETLSAHDRGCLAQLEFKATLLRGSREARGWTWVKTVFETTALARQLGLDPRNRQTVQRLGQLIEDPDTLGVLQKVLGPLHDATLSPFEKSVIAQARELMNGPLPTTRADLDADWAEGVNAIATEIQSENPAEIPIVNEFLDSLDATRRTRLATDQPDLYDGLAQQLTSHDRLFGEFVALLRELRLSPAGLSQLAHDYHAVHRTPRAELLGSVWDSEELTDLLTWYRRQTSIHRGQRVVPPGIFDEVRDYLDAIAAYLDHLVLPTISVEAVLSAARHLPAAPTTPEETLELELEQVQALDYAATLLGPAVDTELPGAVLELADRQDDLEDDDALRLELIQLANAYGHVRPERSVRTELQRLIDEFGTLSAKERSLRFDRLVVASWDVIELTRRNQLEQLSKLAPAQLNAILRPSREQAAIEGDDSHITWLDLTRAAGRIVKLDEVARRGFYATNPWLRLHEDVVRRIAERGVYVNLCGQIDLTTYPADDRPEGERTQPVTFPTSARSIGAERRRGRNAITMGKTWGDSPLPAMGPLTFYQINSVSRLGDAARAVERASQALRETPSDSDYCKYTQSCFDFASLATRLGLDAATPGMADRRNLARNHINRSDDNTLRLVETLDDPTVADLTRFERAVLTRARVMAGNLAGDGAMPTYAAQGQAILRIADDLSAHPATGALVRGYLDAMGTSHLSQLKAEYPDLYRDLTIYGSLSVEFNRRLREAGLDVLTLCEMADQYRASGRTPSAELLRWQRVGRRFDQFISWYRHQAAEHRGWRILPWEIQPGVLDYLDTIHTYLDNLTLPAITRDDVRMAAATLRSADTTDPFERLRAEDYVRTLVPVAETDLRRRIKRLDAESHLCDDAALEARLWQLPIGATLTDQAQELWTRFNGYITSGQTPSPSSPADTNDGTEEPASGTESRRTWLHQMSRDCEQSIASDQAAVLERLSTLDQTQFQREVRAQLEQLAIEGSSTLTALPSLPFWAGRILRFGEHLAQTGSAETDVAPVKGLSGDDTSVRPTLIYVNLRGMIDLSPYRVMIPHTTDYYPAARLDELDLDSELSTQEGRERLILADQRAVKAAYLARFTNRVGFPYRLEDTSGGIVEVLAQTRPYHVGDGRTMVLVPIQLADQVARIIPGQIDETGQIVALQHSVPTYPEVVEGTIQIRSDHPRLNPIPRDIYYAPAHPRIGLFRPDGTPRAEDITQGMLGDCSLIAALRAIARLRPEVITNMITDHQDGTYTVRLHGIAFCAYKHLLRVYPTGQMIEITVNADMPVDNHGEFTYGRTHSALWGAIIEKAFAAINQFWPLERLHEQQTIWNENQSSEILTRNPLLAAPTGYSRINARRPWSSTEYMAMLTGHATIAKYLPKNSSADTLRETGEHLRKLLTDRWPITIGLRWPGMFDHAHELESVTSANSDELLFHFNNPWGVNHPGAMTMEQVLDAVDDTIFTYIDIAPPSSASPPPAYTDIVPPAPGHDLAESRIVFGGDGRVGLSRRRPRRD